MRSDRLKRRTHIKNSTVIQDGEITFYNFTETVGAEARSYYFSDIKPSQLHDDIEAEPYAFESEKDVLDWCRRLFAESPTAAKLWEHAEKNDWQVALTDLHNEGYYLDIPNKALFLDNFSMSASALGRSPYFRNTFLTGLVNALRDVWQEERFGGFESTYTPEDVLMLERVRAADCDTVTIFVGWELRGAGYGDVWRHLIGSAEGDMAIIFTRFLERDPSALFDGSALAYAFRQWYADDTRVDGSDHQTLESLDDQLMGSENANPFGQKELDSTMIEALSELPDGTVYLSGLGQTIKTDPFFAGMNDPINQTHLFHLIYDTEVTMVNNVPFRDRKLAQKLFPQNPGI